ncbi:uncharacterized protein LOC128931562 isoform X2 [Callithrix jacchus]
MAAASWSMESDWLLFYNPESLSLHLEGPKAGKVSASQTKFRGARDWKPETKSRDEKPETKSIRARGRKSGDKASSWPEAGEFLRLKQSPRPPGEVPLTQSLTKRIHQMNPKNHVAK